MQLELITPSPMPGSPTTELYKELESQLLTSTYAQRKSWAAAIIEKDLDLKCLSGLLKSEYKIAIRCLWFLTEIGQLNKEKLYTELPYFYEVCRDLNSKYMESFASFWLAVGVPPEQEAIAIELLFRFLQSAHINRTVKSRAMLVLFELTKKYPELKNELRICLAGLADNYSKDFKKRVNRILLEMEQ
jgi:hypothetical protein